MDPTKKIVTEIPVRELWISGEKATLVRGPYLTKKDIQELLSKEPIQFVISNPGEPLTWIPVSECYDLWKKVVKTHIADHRDNISIDSFPDQYAFIASKWSDGIQMSVILLELIH